MVSSGKVSDCPMKSDKGHFVSDTSVLSFKGLNVTHQSWKFQFFFSLSLQSRPQMVWFSHEQQPILVAAHEGLVSRLQSQSKKTTEISSSVHIKDPKEVETWTHWHHAMLMIDPTLTPTNSHDFCLFAFLLSKFSLTLLIKINSTLL